MASAVLASYMAEVRTHAHICGGGLLQAPFFDRETLEQNKSLGVDQIVANVIEELGHLWQREVLLFKPESEFCSFEDVAIWNVHTLLISVSGRPLAR